MSKEEFKDYMDQGFDTVWTLNPTTLQSTLVSVPIIKVNFDLEFFISKFKGLDVEIPFEDCFISEAEGLNYLKTL